MRVDAAGKPRGWLRPADSPGLAVVRADQSRYDALDAMLRARDDTAVVVDGAGAPIGTVSWSVIARESPGEPS